MGSHSLLQGDLPHPGTEPMSPGSPALEADSLLPEPPGKPVPFCFTLSSSSSENEFGVSPQMLGLASPCLLFSVLIPELWNPLVSHWNTTFCYSLPAPEQSFLTVFCAPKWFSLSLFLILASLQYKILFLSLKISDIRCYVSN